ncbi:MAG: hypothetical protein LBI18_09980, partial [Planctomycetaceae bacterium]|nr:hypothetical protein [Planctomycetaceae bacterium]
MNSFLGIHRDRCGKNNPNSNIATPLKPKQIIGRLHNKDETPPPAESKPTNMETTMKTPTTSWISFP